MLLPSVFTNDFTNDDFWFFTNFCGIKIEIEINN